MAALSDAAALPDGWVELIDPTHCCPYFFGHGQPAASMGTPPRLQPHGRLPAEQALPAGWVRAWTRPGSNTTSIWSICAASGNGLRRQRSPLALRRCRPTSRLSATSNKVIRMEGRPMGRPRQQMHARRTLGYRRGNGGADGRGHGGTVKLLLADRDLDSDPRALPPCRSLSRPSRAS